MKALPFILLLFIPQYGHAKDCKYLANLYERVVKTRNSGKKGHDLVLGIMLELEKSGKYDPVYAYDIERRSRKFATPEEARESIISSCY